jgi:hypothetical protein
MVTIVRKAIFILAFSVLSYASSGQENLLRYEFLRVDKQTGEKIDFEEWIQTKIPSTRERPCEPAFGFFVFRVSSLGKVDSVSYTGTLESEISEGIIDRIRLSQNGWKVSGPKGKTTFQWFLYPFFDFGKDRYTTSNCSPEDKAKQKLLIEVAEKMGAAWVDTIHHSVKILSVSKNGGGYFKL